MASAHLAIGAVLFANVDSILRTDRTLFIGPGMLLPVFFAGDSVVLQYDILAIASQHRQPTIPAV